MGDIPLDHEVLDGSLAQHHLVVDPQDLVFGRCDEEIQFRGLRSTLGYG